MKKLVLAVAFMTTSFGFAQEIGMGLKAGINISSLRGGNGNNSVKEYGSSVNIKNQMNTKVGVYFGGYLEKAISDKGSIVGEAIISFQGAKKVDEVSYSITGAYNLVGTNHSIGSSMPINIIQLNIPVHYKYAIYDKFHIGAGGYVGIIISSKVNGISFSSNTFDLGLLATASYQISDKISADARYNLGLLDVITPYKNSVFQIGVNYKLK